MKSKTSITLSTEVLAELDRMVGKNGSRSDLIERAVRDFLQRFARTERDRNDLEILNESAERMKAEAGDVLRYQVKL
jgi:metal-responsive CopG/Arc/MetJ family transcriptional regulator